MQRLSVFAFDGIEPATKCGIFGLDLNPFDEGGLFGSGDAEKAKNLQKNATHLWTGGAKDPLHPKMVWDEKTGQMVPENTGMFGEIPSVESQTLNYGSGAGDINPYSVGDRLTHENINYVDPGATSWEGSSSAYDPLSSAYAGFAPDQAGRNAEMGAAGYFGNIAAGGRDAQAEADYERARKQAELERRSTTEAALGNLEARGMGNSGDALLAELKGAEGSASDAYQAGLDRSATAQARRDAAATSFGNLGNQIYTQDTNVANDKAAGLDSFATNKAAGQDTFTNNKNSATDLWRTGARDYATDLAKYNADTNNAAKDANFNRANSVSDANTATHNQTVQQNNALQQQNFNNKMAVMQGTTGQMNNQAGTLQQTAVYPLQDAILPTVGNVAKAVA